MDSSIKSPKIKSFMSTDNTIIVNKESHGKRIDYFIKESLPELSRSFIQKLISIGSVLVNKKPAQKSSQSVQIDERQTCRP